MGNSTIQTLAAIRGLGIATRAPKKNEGGDIRTVEGWVQYDRLASVAVD